MSPSNNKHAREAARLRAERQAARRAEARKRRNQRIAIAGSILVVVAAAVGVGIAATHSKGTHDTADDSTLSQPTPSASASTSVTAAPVASTCSYPSAPSTGSGSRNVGTPPTTPAKKVVTATVKTNDGTITFTMDGTKAPCTVNAFTYLASKGYFNNTKCHRLTTSGIFVLQCGDPTGTGSGGPGFSFADENLTGLGTAAGAQTTYPAGTVAMANSGANTNGSQFFLVYKDSPLAASYTPFGTITGGLDVINAIAAKGSNPAGDGAPKETVEIESFTVS